MKTKDVFCANCQDVTEHTAEVDTNGELVFTCECGRFIKVPTEGLSKDKLDNLLEAHQTANEGQMSAEAVEKAKQDVLNKLI